MVAVVVVVMAVVMVVVGVVVVMVVVMVVVGSVHLTLLERYLPYRFHILLAACLVMTVVVGMGIFLGLTGMSVVLIMVVAGVFGVVVVVDMAVGIFGVESIVVVTGFVVFVIAVKSVLVLPSSVVSFIDRVLIAVVGAHLDGVVSCVYVSAVVVRPSTRSSC